MAPLLSLNFPIDGKKYEVLYPSLSDRFVHFYARVADIVAKEMPDRWLGAYAYSVYRTPPLVEKLPLNVMIGFVGLDYYRDDLRQRDLESWNGWAQAADKLMLRPNALIRGHCFPAIYAHRIGEDIKHCYQTGMIAADFDSLMHNWAGQGLNYYVLAQLLWDPSQEVDDIIKDYCNHGFGAASAEVQSYFASLEALTSRMAAGGVAEVEAELREEENTNVRDHIKFWMTAPKFYTPTTIAGLRGLLAEAKKAAGDDWAVKERIEFLGVGLRYAEAQVAAFSAFYGPDSPDKKARVLKALEARQRVYDDIFENHFYAVNVTYPNWREGGNWRRYGWDPGKKE